MADNSNTPEDPESQNGEEQESSIPQNSTRINRFPLTRIKTIMKTDPDVNLASQESVFLLAKATVSMIEWRKATYIACSPTRKNACCKLQQLNRVPQKKKLTLLNSLPIKNVKHFREIFICVDGWRSHLSYDTEKCENNSCLGEHWPLLKRVWKLGCARIGCPFWLSEKSPRPRVEIAGGVMNLIYD